MFHGLLPVSLEVDVNEVLEKAWQRFLSIFGKDKSTQELKSWLQERTRIAFLQARDVQCIGMHRPVQLSAIYQPTLLVQDRPQTITDRTSNRQWETRAPEYVRVDSFLAQRHNSIITAGPGWGKTTFLRAVFIHFLLREKDTVLPILFTLRDTNAVSELTAFVTRLKEIKTQTPGRRILLLVDGYDEIPTEARKIVSEALTKYTSKSVGEYFLTCRDYYDIINLAAPRLRIADFMYEDQVAFADAFLRAYDSNERAEELVQDLHRRGFADLLRHPLLLTLACIVRSNSVDVRPGNVVSLIEEAINALSLRWDRSKGLRREVTTPLDGNARVKCLKRIAFSLDLEPVAQQRVINICRKFLDNTRWGDVDPLELLFEMAQFYGIFVPIADRWGFVHRSLQDFLAAQYWVETGGFAKDVATGNLKYDSRAAFAGCLMEDATAVMEGALRRENGLSTFVEMLANDPTFNHPKIASAILAYYSQFKGEHYYVRDSEKVECYLDQEFVTKASSKFLDYIVQVCGPTRGKTQDTLTCYAIEELVRRKIPLSQLAFDACKKNFSSDRFTIDVRKGSYLRFIDVPHLNALPNQNPSSQLEAGSQT